MPCRDQVRSGVLADVLAILAGQAPGRACAEAGAAPWLTSASVTCRSTRRRTAPNGGSQPWTTTPARQCERWCGSARHPTRGGRYDALTAQGGASTARWSAATTTTRRRCPGRGWAFAGRRLRTPWWPASRETPAPAGRELTPGLRGFNRPRSTPPTTPGPDPRCRDSSSSTSGYRSKNATKTWPPPRHQPRTHGEHQHPQRQQVNHREPNLHHTCRTHYCRIISL